MSERKRRQLSRDEAMETLGTATPPLERIIKGMSNEMLSNSIKKFQAKKEAGTINSSQESLLEDYKKEYARRLN